MVIDGIEYTLLRDYDQAKGIYKHLTFDGKITYLDSRVQKILTRPCAAAMNTALKTDLGLILTTAICAGISAAGTFLSGGRVRGKDKQYFLSFVKIYMDPVLQNPVAGDTTWADWLYGHVRCGLAHSFAIDLGGVEFEISEYVELKRCGPEISPAHLLADFAQGFLRYLQDVRNSGPTGKLGADFEKRFEKIFHD